MTTRVASARGHATSTDESRREGSVVEQGARSARQPRASNVSTHQRTRADSGRTRCLDFTLTATLTDGCGRRSVGFQDRGTGLIEHLKGAHYGAEHVAGLIEAMMARADQN